MMIETRIQPVEQSTVLAGSWKPARIFFLDCLRAALVILVVLHHVAVIYGEGMSFYYVEPPNKESLTYLVLLVFVLLNQSWFMGALFLVAGYVTPGSYDRKGAGTFLKGRLLRLGIPLIIWVFVLNPLACIGLYLEPAPRIPGPFTWEAYPYLIGLGPMWFVALLLIFNVGYAAWRMLPQNRTAAPLHTSSLPGYLGIGLLMLALALASYLLRIVIPIGLPVNLFVSWLSFPSLAYLPQYLSFFVIGMLAYRRDWLQTLPSSKGIVGFVAAVVAFVLLFPLAFFGGLEGQFLGGGHWQSAVYALWDSITAVGLSLGIIVLFRRAFNGSGRFGRFLARHSYTVYIIHSLVLVALAIALRDTGLDNMLKFALVAGIAVPLCFVVAAIIRRVPLVARVV
jgi:peptidoglycan/LPS O-acetylase OafA/YrhL